MCMVSPKSCYAFFRSCLLILVAILLGQTRAHKKSVTGLEQVENGESEPKNVESLVSRLIEIVKSNMVLFLSITALFVATIVAVLILTNAIFSIEYDKVNFL